MEPIIAIPIRIVKLKSLVVLLENCLTDVPKTSENSDKDCEENLPTTSVEEQLMQNAIQTTTSEEVNSFINCRNGNIFIGDENKYATEGECVLSSDPFECVTQTLCATESLLQLPISKTSENEQIAKGSMVGNDSDFSWEKLAERPEVKTTFSSETNSDVDVELTPPGSITSVGSVFGGKSTSFQDTFAVDFTALSEEASKVDKSTEAEKDICKELQVKLVCLEPSLRQLQILCRRSKAARSYKRCLRPKSCLKRFVPYMFKPAETSQNYVQNNARLYQRRKKKRQLLGVFLSTPKAFNMNSFQGKGKKTMQMGRKFRKKQLEKALKQKKAFEKKQAKMKESFEKKCRKLALMKKKEAIKYRSKFENALDGINKRVCNQNSFWRMLPRQSTTSLSN